MRVLVTGSNGFIGGHVVRALSRQGHQVVACVHREGVAHGVETMRCDFASDHDFEAWMPRLKNIDAVVNTVGMIRERRGQRFEALHRDAPQALFDACERAGVRRVIQISALGADASAQSRYHLTKRAADDDLARRDLDWLILRPSVVYGPGAQSSSLFRALAALPRTPLVGNGEQLIQPIHVGDLVSALLVALETGAPNRTRVDCVGPAPLSFAALLSAWRVWLGLGELSPVRVPDKLALFAGRIGGFFGSSMLDMETVRMLQRGNHADAAQFHEAFGFRPRSLDLALSSEPATEADRWHARIYFLKPMLRLSLALMWIWAGLTSAFFFPTNQSYELLRAFGITGLLAPAALYSAAALDTVLGLALLAAYRVKTVGGIQVGVMLIYSALITWGLPSLWLHPAGPVAKNLPLMVATLMMVVLEERKK